MRTQYQACQPYPQIQHEQNLYKYRNCSIMENCIKIATKRKSWTEVLTHLTAVCDSQARRPFFSTRSKATSSIEHNFSRNRITKLCNVEQCWHTISSRSLSPRPMSVSVQTRRASTDLWPNLVGVSNYANFQGYSSKVIVTLGIKLFLVVHHCEHCRPKKLQSLYSAFWVVLAVR